MGRIYFASCHTFAKASSRDFPFCFVFNKGHLGTKKIIPAKPMCHSIPPHSPLSFDTLFSVM